MDFQIWNWSYSLMCWWLQGNPSATGLKMLWAGLYFLLWKCLLCKCCAVSRQRIWDLLKRKWKFVIAPPFPIKYKFHLFFLWHWFCQSIFNVFLFFVFLVYRRTHFTVCSEGNLSSVRILFLCLPTTWKSSIALISIIHLSGLCADQPQGLTVSILDKADRFILLVSRFLFPCHFYAFLKGCVLSVETSVFPW